MPEIDLEEYIFRKKVSVYFVIKSPWTALDTTEDVRGHSNANRDKTIQKD